MSGPRPLVVGLTGGIGSGKSLVGELFARRGVPVIDADIVARELVEPGSEALEIIARRFGAEVLDASGRLDRGALRRIVFQDATRRRELEAILHPRVREHLGSRIAEIRAGYCVVIVPLLLESGMQDLVDRILVVDTTPKLQIGRTVARDRVSEEEAKAVLAAQLGRAERLAAADDVILNTDGTADLEEQVERLHQRYSILAQHPNTDRVDGSQ